MLNYPMLTVIMPVYNTADYLPRAFDALLNQEEDNFKLIVVDDGSTDNSAEVIKKYQSKFRYFKFIQQENQGPSAARNKAMEFLDTPYFTFHDGDDWTDPGYTAFFIRAFKKYPQCDLVCCGYYINTEKGKQHAVGTFDADEITKEEAYLKMTNVFGSPVKGYSWNKAYRTEIVKANNLQFDPDIALLEDQIFNVKYTSLARSVYFTQTPYYHYLQRKGSIIHQPNLKKVKDNFRGNYRVWQHILKSVSAECKEKQAEKKMKLREDRK
ncbi:MAG: glycosyltransferase family A protein [Lactobacillus sp.]|nr:glycosyltransferase family A protein [Lactobacillus sp.]